jgi:hypothetical protein
MVHRRGGVNATQVIQAKTFLKFLHPAIILVLKEVKIVKTSRIIDFAGMAVCFFILIVPVGWTQPMTDAKGPVITGSYAVDRGQYGIVWRIYIEAEAADAEMTKIASVVDQAGQGRYPTDYILLDPQYRKRLRGYLQWNTFSSMGGALKEGDQITLRVSVIDRAGHESREVIFPFLFVSGVKDQDRLPAPFDQQNIPRIGHIAINLVSQGKDSVQ